LSRRTDVISRSRHSQVESDEAALTDGVDLSGILRLYTDASVRGPKKSDGTRERVGPGFIAWCGWHDGKSSDRPTFAGQAYVGEQGTQTGEFEALLYGLSATIAYAAIRSEGRRPDRVIAHLDNDCDYRIMTRDWKASALAAYYRAAVKLEERLLELGLTISYVKVSDTNRIHRGSVHSMSTQANNQVLVKPEWRFHL
jgi:hypothetical protein